MNAQLEDTDLLFLHKGQAPILDEATAGHNQLVVLFFDQLMLIMVPPVCLLGERLT